MTKPEASLLARRLDHLFRTITRDNGRPYSYRAAAEAINAKAGEKLMSANYLMYLRKGERDTPSHERLLAIADFFGVPTSYFTDETTSEDPTAEAALLAALGDRGVRSVAVRAAGLPPEDLEAIIGLIDNARRLRGLPSVEENRDKPSPRLH